MRYGDLFHSTLHLCDDKDKALDIQVLIEEAFRLTRTGFWIKKNDTIRDKKGLQRFYRLRSRLLKGEPLAYILKKKEFFSRTFFVNKHVLIPRPETEIVVLQAAAWARQLKRAARILDIGTGSGNIAVTLALETGAQVVAVDNCRKALCVLEKNIADHGVKEQVIPVRADLFPPRQHTLGGLFDIIVSNPPYVSPQEWETLPAAVKDWEPRNALLAAQGGYAVTRRIAEKAGEYLKSGGKLFLEIGFGQQQGVAEILRGADFQGIEFFNDYSQIPRAAAAQKRDG